MAIAVIAEIPGGNAQMDEAMRQQLGVTPETPPAGALARLAGPIEGGWRIFSVWDSQESWDTFRQEKLEPMFNGMGRGMPTFETWQLDTFFGTPAR